MLTANKEGGGIEWFTLEHISCSAMAMALAGALQRNTWHFNTQLSLSPATKAKSLNASQISHSSFCWASGKPNKHVRRINDPDVFLMRWVQLWVWSGRGLPVPAQMGACQRQRKSVLVQTVKKEMEGENDFITMCHKEAVNKCYQPSLTQWLSMVSQAHDKYILLAHLPLLQPTPHTRMFTIGWQCSRVWSKGSSRVRVSFFRTSIISLPCRRTRNHYFK